MRIKRTQVRVSENLDKFVKYCPKTLHFLLAQPFDAIKCIILTTDIKGYVE